MKSYSKLLILMILLIIFLSGCWDQNNLKKARLGYGVGYDLTTEGDLKQTIEVMKSGQIENTNEIHSAKGKNIRDTTDALRYLVSGDLQYFKYAVLLLGKKLVQEKDLYSYMDVEYRDPDNPTSNVKLAVIDGETTKAFELRTVNKVLIGEFITGKIKSLENMSVFPKETVETIFTKMFATGQDFVLPYLKIEGKELSTVGTALFHEQKMTGFLNIDQSILHNLLNGSKGRIARFNVSVEKDTSNDINDYITIDLGQRKLKRDFKVNVKHNGDITVDLSLYTKARVIEYPKTFMENKSELKHLNSVLSQKLTKMSEEVINKLQESKCDSLSVGRQLVAHHPKVWKKKNWNEDYAKVKFNTKVKVEIVESGALE